MAAVLKSNWPAAGEGACLSFERSVDAAGRSDRTLMERRLSLAERDDEASAPLLGNTMPLVERWLGAAPVRRHEEPGLQWCADAHLLAGTVRVDEHSVEGGLGPATAQAYATIFAVLSEQGFPHLLRVWNYIARINEPSNGLERYRQFNIGRQEAFLHARRSAFAGSPAACALGTERGPLTVHFLAGRCEPRAVENPRQVSAYHYPSEYGPRTPTFSRAALAPLAEGGEALFVSGTASIVGHATLHAGDVRRQTLETMDNLDALMHAANARSGLPAAQAHRVDDLICTVYVRHSDQVAAVREAFESRVGAGSLAARAAVYLRADICRSDLLVEIEAHRLVGGRAA
jgi:enamine deaminase RidA (YjgF/YER057c/UK114 family)